jgi:hypothetical protein
VGEADADPQRFLAYLIEAVRLRLPGLSDLPLAVLHEGSGEGNPAVWTQVLDALINALADADLPGPALFILDDYHLVADTPAIQRGQRRRLAVAGTRLDDRQPHLPRLAQPGQQRGARQHPPLPLGRRQFGAEQQVRVGHRASSPRRILDFGF